MCFNQIYVLLCLMPQFVSMRLGVCVCQIYVVLLLHCPSKFVSMRLGVCFNHIDFNFEMPQLIS